MEFINAGREHFAAITQLVSSPDELYLVYPSGQYPWTLEQLEKLAAIRSDFTVCSVDGAVVAFANLYNVVSEKSAFIGNVIVADAYKGRGIGKRLAQYMTDLCITKYAAVPHLSVFSFNTRAMLMYHHLGFEPYALEERKNLQGESVALVHMRYLPSSMSVGDIKDQSI